MSLFEKNILFYSDYCIHSTNFINNLMSEESLFESFVKINIDVDPNTRKRPPVFYTVQEQMNFKIAEVPTIIVDNANYILSGIEAFKWLEYHIKKIEEEKKELSAFNPNEMGSFSDSYSPLGNDNPNNASEQSFKFVGKPDQRIETPQEKESKSISQDDYNRKQQEREAFDNISGNPLRPNLNAKLNAPVNTQRNNAMGNSLGMGNTMRMGQVGNSMDSKLQQLISERQTSIPQVPRYPVDFNRK